MTATDCIDKAVSRRFSWHRVAMVGRYYYPVIRWMLWVFPLVSLALYMAAWGLSYTFAMPLCVPMLGLVSYLFYFAPLALTRRHDRMLSTMLPATAAERFTFMLLFFFVVVPLITVGVQYVLSAIFQVITPGHGFLYNEYLDEIGRENTIDIARLIGSKRWMSIISALLAPSVVLWGVNKFRNNRVILSVVSYIVVNIAFGLIVGIWTIVMTFTKIIPNIDKIDATGSRDVEDVLATQFMPQLIDVATLSVVLQGICAVVALVLTYRVIKKYQA